MGTEEGDRARWRLQALLRLPDLVEPAVDPGPQLRDRLLRLAVGRALRDDDLDALVRVDLHADATGARRAADRVLQLIGRHGQWRLRGAAVGEDGGDRVCDVMRLSRELPVGEAEGAVAGRGRQDVSRSIVSKARRVLW
jgi:hypothetical protein